MVNYLYIHYTDIITNPSSCALLHCYSQCHYGSELAFNITTNKAILNGVSYEETYYISVCAINAIGKEKLQLPHSQMVCDFCTVAYLRVGLGPTKSGGAPPFCWAHLGLLIQ